MKLSSSGQGESKTCRSCRPRAGRGFGW